MGIVSDILSRVAGKGDRDTVEGVQAALDRLKDERTAANAAIRIGYERRKDLLLQDGSDDEIIKVDLERDRLGIVIERLEAVEEDLYARLRALGTENRAKQFKTHRTAYEKAAGEFVAAIRTASAKFAAVTAAIDAARMAGFEAEFSAGALPTAPSIIGISDPNFIDPFELAVMAKRDKAAARVVLNGPAARAVAANQEPAAKTTVGAPRAVRLNEAPAKAPPPRRPIVETAGPGEMLVEVLRAGYEPREGLQCIVGDRIALPKDIADRVIQNGAATRVELPEAAE